MPINRESYAYEWPAQEPRVGSEKPTHGEQEVPPLNTDIDDIEPSVLAQLLREYPRRMLELAQNKLIDPAQIMRLIPSAEYNMFGKLKFKKAAQIGKSDETPIDSIIFGQHATGWECAEILNDPNAISLLRREIYNHLQEREGIPLEESGFMEECFFELLLATGKYYYTEPLRELLARGIFNRNPWRNMELTPDEQQRSFKNTNQTLKDILLANLNWRILDDDKITPQTESIKVAIEALFSDKVVDEDTIYRILSLPMFRSIENLLGPLIVEIDKRCYAPNHHNEYLKQKIGRFKPILIAELQRLVEISRREELLPSILAEKNAAKTPRIGFANKATFACSIDAYPQETEQIKDMDVYPIGEKEYIRIVYWHDGRISLNKIDKVGKRSLLFVKDFDKTRGKITLENPNNTTLQKALETLDLPADLAGIDKTGGIVLDNSQNRNTFSSIGLEHFHPDAPPAPNYLLKHIPKLKQRAIKEVWPTAYEGYFVTMSDDEVYMTDEFSPTFGGIDHAHQLVDLAGNVILDFEASKILDFRYSRSSYDNDNNRGCLQLVIQKSNVTGVITLPIKKTDLTVIEKQSLCMLEVIKLIESDQMYLARKRFDTFLLDYFKPAKDYEAANLESLTTIMTDHYKPEIDIIRASSATEVSQVMNPLQKGAGLQRIDGPTRLYDGDPMDQKGIEFLETTTTEFVATGIYGTYLDDGRYLPIKSLRPYTHSANGSGIHYTLTNLPELLASNRIALPTAMNSTVVPGTIVARDKKGKKMAVKVLPETGACELEIKGDYKKIARIDYQTTNPDLQITDEIRNFTMDELRTSVRRLLQNNDQGILEKMPLGNVPQFITDFIESISHLSPLDQALEIKHFFVRSGQYDYRNSEMQERKANTNLNGRMKIMAERAEELSGQKDNLAGVCLDFAQVALYMMRELGLPAVILEGYYPPADGKLKTSHMHAIVGLCYPDETHTNLKLIPIDVTPPARNTPDTIRSPNEVALNPDLKTHFLNELFNKLKNFKQIHLYELRIILDELLQIDPNIDRIEEYLEEVHTNSLDSNYNVSSGNATIDVESLTNELHHRLNTYQSEFTYLSKREICQNINDNLGKISNTIADYRPIFDLLAKILN